jgi:hypothetical protein
MRFATVQADAAAAPKRRPARTEHRLLGRCHSLDVASSGSSRSASAGDSRRACEENIGAGGDVAIREFHDPKVHSVRELEIIGDGDVTAAARALVAFGDGDLPHIPLVELDGGWRVVLLREADKGRGTGRR